MASRINIGPENGPYIAINENNGDIELQDNTGGVVAKWDDGQSQWDFVENNISGVGAFDSESVNTEQITGDVVGGNTTGGLHGTSDDIHVIGHTPFLPGETPSVSSTSFTDLGATEDRFSNPNVGDIVDMLNVGDVQARLSGQVVLLDQPATIRHRDDTETEVALDSTGTFSGTWGSINRNITNLQAKLEQQTNGDEVEFRNLAVSYGVEIQ